MGMEELSSDSEDGSGQPSHIARYEQWLEQKATRPPSPPPPPRTSESRTGLAKEAASSTTSSGPAEEQPGKVPTRTLACLHDGTCNPTVGSCSLLPTHPLGCQGRLKGRQQPRSAQHRPAACGDTDVSDAAQAGRRDGRDGGGGSRIPFQARVPEHPREPPREDKSTDTRDEVRPSQLHGQMRMQVGMWIRYQCWGAGERERRMANGGCRNSSPRSLSCTGLPADANAHALTSSMVAAVVYDIYRADPKKTSWKTVQTLIGPYLAGHPPPPP